jgi:hypothetical protein
VSDKQIHDRIAVDEDGAESSVMNVRAVSVSVPMPMGRFPVKGRQAAYESYTYASSSSRQTPEMFGGISTD